MTQCRRISRLDLLGERGLPSGSIIPQTVELKDIKAIIDLMRKNDLSVFEMEKDGFKLKLQKGVGDQGTAAAALPAIAPLAVPMAMPGSVQPGPGAAMRAPAPAAAEEAEKGAPLKDIV